MSTPLPNGRKRDASFNATTDHIERDRTEHLAGLMPQTPLGSLTPASERSRSPSFRHDTSSHSSVSPFLKWAVMPTEALKILIVPIIFYLNWELVAPWMGESLKSIISQYLGHYPLGDPNHNPFQGFFLLSHYVPTSSPDDPRYQKGYYDLVFIAYYIVFWSMVRQIITVNICRPVARYFRIRKVKLDRFGEQGYAMIYFLVMGCWGYRIMGQLPTFWYRTEYFWLDYPHWNIKPELKRYYLMQTAYWCQQFLILVLGLEKPRKDYAVLVVHHIVTVWLVGWSYLTNMTPLGSAVFMSMDIPDSSLALSMLLNYMQKERSKTVAFAVLIVLWTYFRHYLSLVILWSLWFEFDLIPEASRVWHPASGCWMPPWIKYQMFGPLALLQCLNLFWYFLIMRILVRTLLYSKLDDERSDDEDEGDDSKED